MKKLPDEIHEVIWMLGTICLLIGILMVIGWIDSSKDVGWALMWGGIGWLSYKIAKYIWKKCIKNPEVIV